MDTRPQPISEADLELLGYSAKWVACGFLTADLLAEQVSHFRIGRDRNTEHYRYAAFKLVQRRRSFAEQEFEHYVELAACDSDPTMGRAALIDLLHHPGLTEEQWDALLAHPRVQELPRLVKKERLLKELRAPNVPLETLERCVEEGDSDVHRRLLDRADLPLSIIETLQQRGGSKAVRNIAADRLRRRETRSRER